MNGTRAVNGTHSSPEKRDLLVGDDTFHSYRKLLHKIFYNFGVVALPMFYLVVLVFSVYSSSYLSQAI